MEILWLVRQEAGSKWNFSAPCIGFCRLQPAGEQFRCDVVVIKPQLESSYESHQAQIVPHSYNIRMLWNDASDSWNFTMMIQFADIEQCYINSDAAMRYGSPTISRRIDVFVRTVAASLHHLSRTDLFPGLLCSIGCFCFLRPFFVGLHLSSIRYELLSRCCLL